MRIATTIGLFALCVPAACVALLFEHFVVGAFAAWFVLVFCALAVWPAVALESPAEWLTIAGIGAVITALSFALDYLIWQVFYPDIGLFEAKGVIIGTLFTLACAAVTIVSVAGALRCWISKAIS